ncbi:FidL-like protein [Erwinia mallotivora]|uniref:FidL-like protein n=1 Tax=Erwinia mallotivora TaxID=69222 RepID=UPI0021BE5F36|nr:FidL-like protein [Erwinia mallotivora]
MRFSARQCFALSAFVFFTAVGFASLKELAADGGEMMRCSGKGIMFFEDMKKENINGNIHFNFAAKGEGTMVVEGYTDSESGWLYLQRYVKFHYTSHRINASQRDYRISDWKASASSIDASPDIIFDYFMREMSDSHDGLFLNAQKLNDKAVLLSSINSPLFICILNPDSEAD